MLTVAQTENYSVVVATYLAVKTAHQEYIKDIWLNKKYQSYVLWFATEKSKNDFFALLSEIEGI
jgi:hypothetical protein